jgi:hypothetical protein
MSRREAPDSFGELRAALPAAYRVYHHASGSPQSWTFDLATIEQPAGTFSDIAGVSAFALRRLQALFHITSHGSIGLMVQSLIADTLVAIDGAFPRDGSATDIDDLYNALTRVLTEISEVCGNTGWNVYFKGLDTPPDELGELDELDPDED